MKKKARFWSLVVAVVAAFLILCLVTPLGTYVSRGFSGIGEKVTALVSGGDAGSASSDTEGAVENAEEDSKEDAGSDHVDSEKSSGSDDAENKEATYEDTELIFVGDVLLSDYVLSNYNASGIDGVVSRDLRVMLTEADIFCINNEFPFSTGGTQETDKQYTFRVNPSYVTILNELGVDVATLANNHVLDYGTEALSDTFTTLEGAGILYTGAGNSLDEAAKLVTVEVNGKTYGFLAASRVIPKASWNVVNRQPGVFTCYDPTELISRVQEAKEVCDYVFVSVHWGTEHTDVLTDYQESMAHQLVDAGATAVIGAHPHVLQNMEYYNGSYIFYSLGNFVFNQSIDSTMAVKYTVDGETGEVSVTLIPATASGATTSLAGEEKASSIISYLQGISSTVSISAEGEVTPAGE